ncbi:MAG TPA: peptide chain release factor N(5)-glutamine methyltransferase [Pyrinomonadaceae bacterium]|nr:peptide chain release factor N(5)-glutamine methyltransferase [Pyrinomonadaceae bacterium]
MTREPKPNIADSVARASAKLQDAGIDDARREASSLMAFAIGKTSAFIFAHPEYELTEAESKAFDSAVERREAREPFHYIVGRKEFYGLDFTVAPGVLIPRPETELLVEDAINILGELPNPRFVEIGVGSGCISVSILHNSPRATAVAVDISEPALGIARKNAEFYNVADRLALHHGDVYQGVEGEFDLIVSNPPYIPDSDLTTLQTEVGSFEPHSALFGGDDGLYIVRRIVADAPKFLKKGGHILIEIGFGQARSVKELFDVAIWCEIDFIRDLQGIERIAKARLN